jgi:hypothetical protein
MNVTGSVGAVSAGQHIGVTKFRSGVLPLWSGDDNLGQPEPKGPGPNPNAANVEHTLTPEVRRRQARLERAVLARLEHERPIGKDGKASDSESALVMNPKANLIALSVDATLGPMFRPSSEPKLDVHTEPGTEKRSPYRTLSDSSALSAARSRCI